MWTEEQRLIYRREGDGYPSDLWDAGVGAAGANDPAGAERRSTTSFASSSVMASGRRSGSSCTWRCASGWAGRPAPRRRFSTANRSNRQERGGRDGKAAYDAGKKVKGRKIHALVDSEGLPMRVVVHSAAIQDHDRAGLVLDKIRRRFPWLELIWADGGNNAWQVDAGWQRCRCCAWRSSSGATT